MISAVPLPTPDIDNMVDGLDLLIERVKAGEFVSLLIVAFNAEREMLSLERGKRMSRVELIGLLECWKADLLDTMQVKPEQL